MASHTSGYQGFRSFSAQTCATLKPGESYDARATKFSQMGSSIITPPPYNRVGRHSFESVAMQSMQLVQPGDYKVPDKHRGGNKLPTSRKFLTPSTYQVDYPSYEGEMRTVLGTDIGAFEHAFHAVATDSEQDRQPHPQQHEAIELSQVPRVVQLALREAANARVVELFVSFFDHGPTPTSPFKDNITWPGFKAAVEHIGGLFERELGGGARVGSGAGSALAKTEQAKVIPATTPASSYQSDFGRYGDAPLERPYVRRRGMASTTDDLQPGTAKQTFHMPGYMGFIPRTTHNPDAVAHGEGAVLHGRKDELRLYVSDNIAGYTGHKPVDCKNYRGECRAGSDSQTSTGAAYRPHL